MIVHIIHLYQRDAPGDHDIPGIYGVVEDVGGRTEYPFTSREELWRILQRLLPASEAGGPPGGESGHRPGHGCGA